MRVLDERARFRIRAQYVGRPVYGRATDGQRECATQALLDVGASDALAKEKAGYLLHVLASMDESRREIESWDGTKGVKALAENLVGSLDSFQAALDPHKAGRFYAATAQALAELESDEPELMGMSGLGFDVLADRLAVLDTLRSALTQVAISHTQGPGRPPREIENEALSELARIYVQATGGKLPSSSNSEYAEAGGRTGPFVDFVRELCAIAGVPMFSDWDLRAVHDAAKSRRSRAEETPK